MNVECLNVQGMQSIWIYTEEANFAEKLNKMRVGEEMEGLVLVTKAVYFP